MAYVYPRAFAAALLLVLATAPLFSQRASIPAPPYLLHNLRQDLRLPVKTTDGSLLDLQVVRSPVVGKSLRRRFPDIEVYRVSEEGASGSVIIVDGTLRARLLLDGRAYHLSPPPSITSSHLMLAPDQPGARVDDRHVAPACQPHESAATVVQKFDPVPIADRTVRIGDDPRIFDLVVVTTGEYYAANGSDDKAVTASVIESVMFADEVFRRDLAVGIRLADVKLYSDFATDPFAPTVGAGTGRPLPEQAAEAVAGSFAPDVYQLGMVFHNGFSALRFQPGGVARVGAVCQDTPVADGSRAPSKGAAWSGSEQPTNDGVEWYRLVTHELGHLFGATHTWNGLAGDCALGISPETAVEIGSGTTIMSYAGRCETDESTPDDLSSSSYFHIVSIAQIDDHLKEAACPDRTSVARRANVNTRPEIDGNPCSDALVVPRLTPFQLRGEATDADNDLLSYSWEAIDDDGDGAVTQGATNTQRGQFSSTAPLSARAPLFRNYPPADLPFRNFPRNPEGIATEFEALPDTVRELKFAFVVRDNAGDFSGLTSRTSTVRVDESGPLRFAGPDGSGEELVAGQVYAFRWQTNGSEALCATAVIEMSQDGGRTYPWQLGELDYASASGRVDLRIPATADRSRQVRFRVRCADSPCRTFFAVTERTYRMTNDGCDAVPTTLAEVTTVLAEAGTSAADLARYRHPPPPGWSPSKAREVCWSASLLH